MQHKQLPANPSLEHLKSQAKQLLKAHKDGSPDALQRIRSFFPKLSDATDVEIQNTAFGLQDAQLVIAREYGFASWTRLKEAVRHQERDAEKISPKDLLFQILGIDDHTQADIQRVEELITADPSLVSVKDENGRTPIEALAARDLINFGKERWYRPIRQLYDLLVENGAVPDLAAALVMDDWARAGAYVAANPRLLEQQFVCGNQIKFRPIEIAAAYGRDFALGMLCQMATANGINIEKDLASALTQTFALDVTERLLETAKPAASVLTNALVFACEVYQPEKVRLLLKYGADPSASVKAKFRYDVVQNLKLGDDGSHTCERSPLFLPGTKTLASEIVSHTEYTIEFVPKLKGTKTLASETVSHTYEMSPLLVAIGTWYGVREAAEALDECLEVVEALLEVEPDLQRSYKVDIDGEILKLTPLAYTQKLVSLFPDKPFDKIIEVLLAADAA